MSKRKEVPHVWVVEHRESARYEWSALEMRTSRRSALHRKDAGMYGEFRVRKYIRQERGK